MDHAEELRAPEIAFRAILYIKLWTALVFGNKPTRVLTTLVDKHGSTKEQADLMGLGCKSWGLGKGARTRYIPV